MKAAARNSSSLLIVALLFALIIMVISCSCNGNNAIHSAKQSKRHLKIEVKDIDYSGKTSFLLQGIQSDIEVLGADDILIVDSLLMVQTKDPRGQLKVFNVNTHKLLANLCLEGRANNEFINPLILTKQSYKKGNDIILIMTDNNKKLKEINISESIKNQSTVVIGSVDIPSAIDVSSIVIDNDINKRLEYTGVTYDHPIRGDFYAPKFIIKQNKEEVDDINVFPKLMDYERGQDVIAQYCGVLSRHPDKNLVLLPFQNMDYILFLDLDNNEYFAIHQTGAMTFDDFLPKYDPSVKHTMTFTDIACSSNFFFILYWSSERNKTINESSDEIPVLLIFDYSGNFIASTKLDTKINRIAIDVNDNVLYGINCPNDIFYTFDVNNLLSSIYKQIK